MTRINAIELPNDFDGYKNVDGEQLSELFPISNINIFVGSNNSGKSRFMRILACREAYNPFKKDELKEILAEFESITKSLLLYLQSNKISLNGINTFALLNRQRDFSFDSKKDNFSIWRDSLDTLANLPGDIIISSPYISQYNRLDFINTIRDHSSNCLTILKRIPIPSEFWNKSVYIPILRGLRPIDEELTDVYAKRTHQDYFKNTNHQEFEIFTGLSLYQRLTDMLLGDNNERKIIADYQNFISKTLFEGKSIALIPNPKAKTVVVKIGSEKEQPIYHLGDGIQSAIILSFLPYITKEPSFFFIEEPEMFLHPGLQRKILEFFASCSQHTFFLTTHSNHFLDLTIDIKEVSIFTFRKQLPNDDSDEQTATFTVEAVDGSHHSSLELLGVRNSSVFLVNATIWVEGITDRWYFRKMLESYMDTLADAGESTLRCEEDVHYSFVEYGGANITHWSFLEAEDHPIEVERLCAKAVVIIDDDGNKKLARKEKLREILGERLIILPAREIENLLPYDVISKVVLEYEKTPDRQLPQIQYTSYQNELLGTFIEKRIFKDGYTRKGGYKGSSGTINGKVDFCSKALPHINYENLPQSTKEVIHKIYNFIKKQNT